MHLISPLLLRESRPSQSILKEGQQNTFISVSCLRCSFRSRAGRCCKPRRNEHSSQGFQHSSRPAPCSGTLSILLSLLSPHLPACSSHQEGPVSMPLPRPVYPCGMLSWLFSNNSRFAISAQPPQGMPPSQTCPGLDQPAFRNMRPRVSALCPGQLAVREA